MTPENMLSNPEIAVYALALLGGATNTVYTEEIAAKCFELLPSRFGWRLPKFREKGWPDKEVARSALEDAQKDKKHEPWVAGDSARDLADDGWRLAPHGVAWLRENEDRIRKALGLEGSELPRVDSQRLRKRIMITPLFDRFSETGSLHDAPKFLFTDLLCCNPDAENETIAELFQRLLAQAELLRDQVILDFLYACEAEFIDSPRRIRKGEET